MAEGVGFEPTLGFPLSLISSQVPSTTQPPFRSLINNDLQLFWNLQLDFLILQSDTVRMNTSETEKDSEWQNAIRKSGPLQIIGYLFRTLPREGQADSARA